MRFIEKLLSKNLSDKAVDIGEAGEDAAEKILIKNGYKIIERNFNAHIGEIDIIARDGEYTCFVEVRFRKSVKFGTPSETIDRRKQEKLIRAANVYIIKNNLTDTPLRFDAVVITGDVLNNKKQLNYELIKNAFEC